MTRRTSKLALALAAGSVLLLVSCQTILRLPASILQSSTLSGLQNLMSLTMERQKLEHQKYLLQLKNKEDLANPEFKNNITAIEDEISQISAKINHLNNVDRSLNIADSSRLDQPISFESNWNQDWRNAAESFFIRDLNDFPLDQTRRPIRTHILRNFQAAHFQLELRNTLFSRRDLANGISKFDRNDTGNSKNRHLEVRVTCDKEFQIKKLFGTKDYLAGSYASFNLFDEVGSGEKIKLGIAADTKDCFAYFMDPETKTEGGVRLVTEKTQHDPYENLMGLIDGCAIPKTDKLKGVEKFFLSSKYNSMTCPQSIPRIQPLADSKEGLRHKFRALMGYDLTNAQVEAQNPYLSLDFSRAPALDAIYISSLVFRADFYGTLLSRLLEFHAQRGVSIKIINSEVIETKKDHELFLNLSSRYPNFQFQEFQYESASGETILDKLDQLHRTNHVKFFATLSKSVPENNLVILGGRNVHDGFVFKRPRDHSEFPRMVNYAKQEDGWSSWRDFEAEFKDKAFAEKMAAHFLTLWQRDTRDILVRSLNVNLVANAEIDPNYFTKNSQLVRHTISIPYRDNYALVDFFADMIASAQKKILISTPYFRPTEQMAKALNEAIDRGVEITLITRLDLKTDTAGAVLSDANKEGVNRFIGKMKMYEYTEPNVILHAKLFLIDDKFTFMGSVNLNKRSFFHDLENGAMIYSSQFNQRMTKIYSTYLKQSRLIEKPLRVKLFPALFLKAFDSDF